MNCLRGTWGVIKSISTHFFKIELVNLPRILFHSLILAVIIGGFWLLDTIKDPLFATIVGIEHQPKAKVLSVVFMLFTVTIYDYLTSLVSKPTLFYIVTGTYGVMFLIISGCLPNFHNTSEGHDEYYSKELGWLAYFVIESYGSMMVAMFWSFTNSIMDLEEAKGAYGLILSIAQIGAICGSTLAANAKNIGYPVLFLIGSVTSLTVTLLIKLYHIVFKDEITQAATGRVRTWTDDDENLKALELPYNFTTSEVVINADNETESVEELVLESKTMVMLNAIWMWFVVKFGSFCEGLSLIYHHKYVMRILAVSCFYEIVLTVLDYEFKMIGAGSLEPSHSSMDNAGESFKFASLMGRFGQITNLLTMVMSLFGFSFFVNTFGVRNSLLIFPSMLLAAVVVANLVPSLWVLFFIVSALKASTYSLNEPIKELLYQPTSDPIKFKAKAWIDVFGSRLSKASGSFITYLAHGSVSRLQLVSELPSFAIAIMLLVFAWQVGTQFQYLVSTGLIVGECSIDEENRHSVEAAPFRKSSSRHRDDAYAHLPERNGLRPGDVGYDGYDAELFKGVFDGESDSNSSNNKNGNSTSSSVSGQGSRCFDNNVFKKSSKSPKKSIREMKIRSIGKDSPRGKKTIEMSGIPSVEGKNVSERFADDEEECRTRSESADF